MLLHYIFFRSNFFLVWANANSGDGGWFFPYFLMLACSFFIFILCLTVSLRALLSLPCASTNKVIYFIQFFLILGKMVTIVSAVWQQLSVFIFAICFCFCFPFPQPLISFKYIYRSDTDYLLINHLRIQRVSFGTVNC